MLTSAQFQTLCAAGPVLLDGATGSNLMKAGMPRGCCTEQWVLAHPEAIVALQRRYAEAGSKILYAPTFQAQPIALARVGLDRQTEAVNVHLAALTRSVSDEILVAGDLTTLAVYLDSFDPANFDLMVENYRRQIKGLMDGGVDLLAAETLMYPLEAEAILTAAELEGASCCMYTFTMQSDGSFFSGREVGPVLKELEQAGAAAVGFNCVVCKPNAGVPVIGDDQLPHYPMTPEDFTAILRDCKAMGANLLGGCCGTDPAFIAGLRDTLM